MIHLTNGEALLLMVLIFTVGIIIGGFIRVLKR